MNGKRAKQIRRKLGISIQARRDMSNFKRDIDRLVERRAENVIARRNFRRRVLASVALAAIVGSILAGLFL